jgi:hypothetical protein
MSTFMLHMAELMQSHDQDASSHEQNFFNINPPTSDDDSHDQEIPPAPTLIELHSLQLYARNQFKERQARRTRNEKAFRDVFIPWVYRQARFIAMQGFCRKRVAFPYKMTTRLPGGDYNISSYVRGFGRYKSSPSTIYDKSRWDHGKTPFERIAEELAGTIRIYDDSTTGTFHVLIEWDGIKH